MEKLKSVLSHGHKKSLDATPQENDPPTAATTGVLSGEGSHLESVKATASNTGNTTDYHPIYDQFTNQSHPTTTGETTEPAHQLHLVSDSPDTNNPLDPAKDSGPSVTQSESTPTSNLHPDSTLGRPEAMTDQLTTASIKSGVMGFPQGGSQHAALQSKPSVSTTRPEGADQLSDRATTSEQDALSHTGRDAAIGAGTISTGEAVPHELHHQPHHDNLRAAPGKTSMVTTTPASSTQQTSNKDFAQPSLDNSHQQPFERALQEPAGTTDTDRSFPLTGGVTSRKQADRSSATAPVQLQSHVPTTNEREPGTKDENAGFSDSQGREALAGAAAAAAAYSTLPSRSEHSPQQHARETTTAGVAGGAPTNLPREPQLEQKQPPNNHTREALAGATAAVSAAPSPEKARSEDKQTHNGHTREALAGATVAASTIPSEKAQHEHKSSLDPHVADNPSSARDVASGPHKTDTATRRDMHIHIPGEFPETPMETPGERAQEGGGYITQRQPEHRAVEPSTEVQPKHSHGHDAAIGGDVGAAAVGAYSAKSHHQREKTDIKEETTPTKGSPYSATKLDPRVDGKPAPFEEQRFDPTAPTEPSPHKPQQQTTATVPASGSPTGPDIQREPIQPPTEDQSQPKKNEHHYVRDAELAGAAAATAGGLTYASQHGEKADSGPASATIGPHKSNIANIVDPGVQPDPALQKHHQTGPTTQDSDPKLIGSHKSTVTNVVDPRAHPEPEKQKEHTTTAPHKSDTVDTRGMDTKTQPEDQHHTSRDAAVIGSTGAATYGAHEVAKSYDQHRSTQPAASMNDQRYDPHSQGAHDPNQTGQHHYGRDLAIGGGLGAVGAGALAHESSKKSDEAVRNAPGATSQHSPSNQVAPQPQAHQEPVQPSTHQRYDSVQDPNKQHHGRDAAAAGVTGAGAGYAYSQHQAREAEKSKLLAQQKAEAKELERQQKEQQKEFEKKQKEQEKAFQKKEKEMEKQQAKEQKQHNKLVAAEEKAHRKEIGNEQHKQQEAEKAEGKGREKEDGKDKKHHLFGFLHRDKEKKQSPERSPRQSKDSSRYSREFAGAATAGATQEEHEARSKHSKLHKDPPKGHPVREAMENNEVNEFLGTNNPRRSSPLSSDHESKAGSPAVDNQPQYAAEPHTGLPGDSSNPVSGYHPVPGVHEPYPGGGQQEVADWDAGQRGNAPY